MYRIIYLYLFFQFLTINAQKTKFIKLNGTIQTDSIIKLIEKHRLINAYTRSDSLSGIQINDTLYVYIQNSGEISEKKIITGKLSAYLNRQNDLLIKKGYLFNQLKPEKLILKNNTIHLYYTVELNKQVKIDSIIYTGKIFPLNFQKKINRILSGNKSDGLDAIVNFINKQTAFQFKTAPKIVFYQNKSSFLIDVENRNNNLLDASLGFEYSPDEKKMELQGKINTELYNIFKTGEYIGFHWEKYSEIQNLIIDVDFPFIFGSNFRISNSLLSGRKNTTTGYFHNQTDVFLPYQKHSFGLNYTIDQISKQSKTTHSFGGISYQYKDNRKDLVLKKNIEANLYVNTKKLSNYILYTHIKYYFILSGRLYLSPQLVFFHNTNDTEINFTRQSGQVYRRQNIREISPLTTFGLKNDFMIKTGNNYFYIIGDFISTKYTEKNTISYINTGVGIKIIKKNQNLTLEAIKSLCSGYLIDIQGFVINIKQVIKF